MVVTGGGGMIIYFSYYSTVEITGKAECFQYIENTANTTKDWV